MNKKMITKISEGLGNQLFMYAHAYALSKSHNMDFYIDPYSGYYQEKHNYMFFLDKFNISSKIASDNFLFNNFYKNLFKKSLLFVDKFKSKKKFFFERKNIDKSTKYSPIDITNSNDIIFIDGNFESEKYFLNYKKDLLKEFSFKNEKQFLDNKYLKIINEFNVISICIRQNRYSDTIKTKKSHDAITKSNLFVEETIEYIFKSINFFKDKVDNPIYLIWSNNFKGLDKFFDSEKFIFVKNQSNKVITDFYLLTRCKYFIVGPSTFHWWGAWLSNNLDNIIVRPENLTSSNNIDFWPESWISI